MAREFQTADDGFPITASATDFVTEAIALYTGSGGDITLETPQGTTLTFAGTPAGMILPVRAKNVTVFAGTGLIGLLQY